MGRLFTTMTRQTGRSPPMRNVKAEERALLAVHERQQPQAPQQLSLLSSDIRESAAVFAMFSRAPDGCRCCVLKQWHEFPQSEMSFHMSSSRAETHNGQLNRPFPYTPGNTGYT